jgi:hypothetical protein
VPSGDPPPNCSTLEDGRLDELAARYGLTIAEVRRMMGPQQIERLSAAVVDVDEVGRPFAASENAVTVAVEPSALDDVRLEELTASLGVTVGDVRRMLDAAPGHDGAYRGRLDLDEIKRRYEAGESLAKIGTAMGVSDTAVHHAMVRAGIPRLPGSRPAGERRGPQRRIDVDEVRRRWEAGETIGTIARAIGASDKGVRLVMDRAGMERGARRPASGLA